MSGIAGCFFLNSDQYPKLDNDIKIMLTTLITGKEHELNYFSDSKNIALGICNSNKVNTGKMYENENYAVCLNGYFTNIEELICKARVSADDLQNLEPKVVLELFAKAGYKTVELLEGIYALAVWDKRENILFIATDRHGYEFVFYYVDKNKFLFSTEIKPILNLLDGQIEADQLAICDIYGFHTVLNNRTPFKNVNLLPHAPICTVSQDNFSVRTYWDYPQHFEFLDESEKILLDKAKQIVKSSLDRAVHSFTNVGVMLSAGLDSRFLASIARNKFESMKAFSFQFGEAKSREYLISEKIAAQLDMQFHHIYHPHDVHLLDMLEKSLQDTDGHWGFYELIPEIEEISSEYPGIALINGFLMDTLFKSAWMYFPDRGHQEITIENIVNRYSAVPDYIIQKAFTRDFSEMIARRKRNTVEQATEGFSLKNPAETSFRFYCLSRARKSHNFILKAFKKYLYLLLPGADYQLTDFAISLPLRIRSNPNFYLKLICLWFPEVARIAWDKTGKPLTSGSQTKNRKLENFLFKTKYAVQRLSFGKIDLLHSSNSFNRLFRTNRRFRNEVKDILLDGKSLARGFYDRKSINGLVKEQMVGKDYGNIFKALLSVEMLYRNFIDGHTKS